VARFVHEFFQPRVGSGVVFPIGVIAQDGGGIVYAAIADAPLPEGPDVDFYELHDRERFMNEDFLHRVEATEAETGTRVTVEAADRRLLEVLQQQGTHHFVYGLVRTRSGSAVEVAAAEAARLQDKDARRAIAIELLDPITRAAVASYA
jgi:hypothetical protein